MLQSGKAREMLAPQLFFVFETKLIFMCSGENYKCEKRRAIKALVPCLLSQTFRGLMGAKVSFEHGVVVNSSMWWHMLHEMSILGRKVDFSSRKLLHLYC